jgi:hypothetical protein
LIVRPGGLNAKWPAVSPKLRPPRASIHVASQCFVCGVSLADISPPANLESLCDVDLAAYGAKVDWQNERAICVRYQFAAPF